MEWLRVFSCLLIFLLLAYAGAAEPATEVLKFRITEEGGKITYAEELRLTKFSRGWFLEINSDKNSLDQQYYQFRWQVADSKAKSQYTAIRQRNQIVLAGVFKGKPVKKAYQLDNQPWFQYPEISLQTFLATAEQRQLFWIISPADLNIYQFEAVKQCQEQIKIADQLIESIKVRIQPVGFYGAFWHACYWFRLTDRCYLRYEASHGPPLTPPTIKERVF